MSDALLPCPFCGEPGELVEQPVSDLFMMWAAGCPDVICPGHPLTSFGSAEQAVARWNTRTPTSLPPSERAARKLVDAQAEDPDLWFVATTATEAYLQHALRALHAAVEAEPAPAAPSERAEGERIGAARERERILRAIADEMANPRDTNPHSVGVVDGLRAAAGIVRAAAPPEQVTAADRRPTNAIDSHPSGIKTGDKVEVRGSCQYEGGEIEYGRWNTATVGVLVDWGFLVRVDAEGHGLARKWEDEGKTWRRAQATGPGKETPK